MESDDQTWAPASSSEKTNAVYKNPFGFSLQVIRSAETLNIGYLKRRMALASCLHRGGDGQAILGLTTSSSCLRGRWSWISARLVVVVALKARHSV